MEYFRVRNFEKFQHYHTGRPPPPWIKVYVELLEAYEFCELTDDSKFHLIAIWLLASRMKNKIAFDAKFVAGKISSKSDVNLQALLKARFIEMIPVNASKVIAHSDNHASNVLEQSREEKRQSREEKRHPSTDVCTEPPQAADSVPTAIADLTPADGVSGEDSRATVDPPALSGDEASNEVAEWNGQPLVFPIKAMGKGTHAGKAVWSLRLSKLGEYVSCYPTLDVPRLCRQAVQWCRDNPTKRKTFVGMPGFLTRWFNAELNRPSQRAGLPNSAPGGGTERAERGEVDAFTGTDPPRYGPLSPEELAVLDPEWGEGGGR